MVDIRSSGRGGDVAEVGHPDLRRRTLLKAGIAAIAATSIGGVATACGAPPQLPPPLPSAPVDGVQEWKVVWDDRRLDALRRQIADFRFPAAIPGSSWRYGMDPDYLRALTEYWADGFDMQGAATTLNRFPQYMARVGDLDVHFIRIIGEGGPGKVRLPLLSTHGWPGSTFEFWKVAEPLAFPSRFGAAGQPAFDLIVPSLPGHGPSGKPLRPIGARTTARIWDSLMRDVLGYETYYAQGGDWGAGVTGWLALDFPDVVKAIHLNLMIVTPQSAPETDEERRFYAASTEAEQRWGAYYQLQATEPQSLAYAMVDDPVAQAEWLVQRFYQWSDTRTSPFDQVFTMDELLTNVMIYIMNDAFQTSTWFYTGSEEEKVKQMPVGRRVGVPTGFASYSGDARSPVPPRSIVEKGYNLQHWADVPRGGHFAAMEEPELYVQELRDWARSLRL